MRPLPRTVRRRGVGFLFFTLVAIPVIFFAMYVAFDASRYFYVGREVRNAAEAAALAGSYQFTYGGTTLVRDAARNAARDTVNQALSAGAMRGATQVQPQIAVGEDSVTVTIDYQVAEVTPFGRLFNAAAPDLISFSVTEVAYVCIPGLTPTTDGYCTRPA